MREKRRGYAPSVNIGYKNADGQRGNLENKKPVLIMNVKDLMKVSKGYIGIVAGVGAKKKIEIAKKAMEMNIEIWNLNVKKFIKVNERDKK